MSYDEKVSERVTLSFDVPRELRDVVERQAKARLCSVAAHARYLIASAIEAQAARQQPIR